jgi:hypothetical protein
MSDYRLKYEKYKSKYLKLKKQIAGADLASYLPTFNSNFDNEWILTGSEAIKQYLLFFNRSDLLTFQPNDVDIMYVSNDKIYRPSIDGFIRKQTQAENSMTFSKGDLSFDITTIKGPINYYEINGLRLMTPSQMLENYEDNIRENSSDVKKIEALKVIKTLVAPLERKRLPVLVEKKRNLSDSEDSPAPKVPRFFDDNDKPPKMGGLFD